MSDFNLVGWSWRRPCMHHDSMSTYVRAPLRFLSHIHYINSDLSRNFIICGYGIFPSLCCAMSYPRTIYVYKLCICFSFYFVSTILRHFSYYFPLSPRYILSCLLLFPSWIKLFSLLSPFWTWFFLVWPNLNHISNKYQSKQHNINIFDHEDLSFHMNLYFMICGFFPLVYLIGNPFI